jgi:hypothetical protein
VDQDKNMLCSIESLLGCQVVTIDDHLVKIGDVLFDDEAWVVRFLVVKMDQNNVQRWVLVDPSKVGDRDWSAGTLKLSLTQVQLYDSPDVDTHKPVWRQHRLASLNHYSGLGYSETAVECQLAQAENRRAAEECAGPDDPHLRSANEVMTYDLRGLDGEIGHVNGFLIDDKSWVVRFIIVTTGGWCHGRQALIEPESIDDVRWTDAAVEVHLTRQSITDSPAGVAA